MTKHSDKTFKLENFNKNLVTFKRLDGVKDDFSIRGFTEKSNF